MPSLCSDPVTGHCHYLSISPSSFCPPSQPNNPGLKCPCIYHYHIFSALSTYFHVTLWPVNVQIWYVTKYSLTEKSPSHNFRNSLSVHLDNWVYILQLQGNIAYPGKRSLLFLSSGKKQKLRDRICCLKIMSIFVHNNLVIGGNSSIKLTQCQGTRIKLLANPLQRARWFSAAVS